MSTSRVTTLLCTPLLVASFLAAPLRAEAAPPAPPSPVDVSVGIRAPFSGATTPKSLWSVDTEGRHIFGKDFAIPYASLEKQIDDAIDAAIPNLISGDETCDDPCPDVSWFVKITPKFKFTKKNQPKLTQIGSSGQSKVRVELKTQARLDIEVLVFAETVWERIEVPVDLFAEVGLTARVDISLWPTLDAKKPGTNERGLELEFELVDGDIAFEIDGQAAALGFKWGTIIGFTPVGLLAGGPILGPLLAWLGDAAADAASAHIKAIFDRELAKMVEKHSRELEDMANDYINPYITEANDLKDRLLDTPIPGTGKSIDQLRSDFGASIDLHTVATPSSVHSLGILRMSGAAAGGKLFGKVRIPKEVCQYVSYSVGGAGGSLPLGLVAANQDLDAKVGQSCAAALSDKFGRKAFLGANPRAALGVKAEVLPTWSSSAGSLAYVGNVSETADWYECKFELTGLPKASILELSAADLESRGITLTDRFMNVMVGGKSRAFDATLAPLPEGTGGNSSLVIGGKGKCGGGSSGGGLTPNKMKELKDLLDPEKCPQCGLAKKPGSFVYEPANMQKLLGTPFFKKLLSDIAAAKAKPGIQVQPGAVKPSAAKPGAAKPSANQ